MTTQTFGMQHLIRSVLFAAIVAGLAVTSAGRASATQSNGSSINQMVEFQIALCEAGGGKAEVKVDRTIDSSNTGVVVSCTGGLLDGMWCYTTTVGTACSFNLPNPGGGKGSQTVHTTKVPAGQVLTPIDDVAEPVSADQPAISQSTTGDVTAEPAQADQPVTDSGDGVVVDQPVVADETVDPVVTDDPVITSDPMIEPASSVDTTTTPGILIDPTHYQPILIGQ